MGNSEKKWFVITVTKHKTWNIYSYLKKPVKIMEIPLLLDEFNAISDKEERSKFYFNKQWKYFSKIISTIEKDFNTYIKENLKNLLDDNWINTQITADNAYIHNTTEEFVILELVIEFESFLDEKQKAYLKEKHDIRNYRLAWCSYEFDESMRTASVNLSDILFDKSQGLSVKFKKKLQHRRILQRFIYSVSYEFDHLYQH